MKREWPGTALALCVYAVYYLALLYHPGLVRMDDFGYLRSVGETLAAGWPRTDDWLEPYSALVSTAGALAYAVTGDFPLATWGLHALWSLAAFLIIRRCLRLRLEPGPATLLAFALTGLPMYAHKASEFSGNIPTLACALTAFLLYRARRWEWFFAAAFLAFCNRQNALALLALPGWEALRLAAGRNAQGTWGFRDPELRRILIGGACFAAAAVAFHLTMNRTVAQELGIYAGFGPARLMAIARTAAFGLCAVLAFLSAFSLLTGDSAAANLRANRSRPFIPAAATAFFFVVAYITRLPLFSFLTPLLGSLDRGFAMQYAAMAAIPCLYWVLDWRQIRLDGPLLLALGFTAVSGLKGFWYDFYLVDVAVGALLYRLTRPHAFAPGAFAKALTCCIIAADFFWALGYKVFSDKQRLSVHIYERLERAGRVAPADMTDATFGYGGWKLAGPFRDLRTREDLALFQGYVLRDKVVIDTEAPWRRAYKRGADGAVIIEEGVASIGWMNLKYRVMEIQGNPPVSLLRRPPLAFDRERYQRDPFPLNREEWSLWVEGQVARQGGKGSWFRIKAPGT